MILVVSSPKDAHARAVLERIKSRGGEAFLLDLSEFPTTGRLTIEFEGDRLAAGAMTGLSAPLDFGRCNVVWWRRPQPFRLDREIQAGPDWDFSYTECHAAVSGLWLTLSAFWINHPTRDEEAARKVYQLQVAREAGLATPDTCITNDPEVARGFVRKHGHDRVIYKAFSGTEQAWRETRKLKREELESLDSVQFAPVIFQSYVPAQADLRITMVDGQIFACAIDTRQTEYQVDFRMVMDQAKMTPARLPKTLRTQLVDYMRRLGLVYGAIDMRLTPDGKYVFLEINPSGQWLFVEQRTGLPITDAMAALMLEKDRKR